jgi:hypothetical protein
VKARVPSSHHRSLFCVHHEEDSTGITAPLEPCFGSAVHHNDHKCLCHSNDGKNNNDSASRHSGEHPEWSNIHNRQIQSHSKQHEIFPANNAVIVQKLADSIHKTSASAKEWTEMFGMDFQRSLFLCCPFRHSTKVDSALITR